MEYKLEADSFFLLLRPEVYDSDIQYPNNTIMKVNLNSRGFSACTTMDIDIKEFKRFASALNDVYEALHGSAAITEPYGKQIIQFSADKTGHIMISGMLHNYGNDGGYQSLRFETSVDQTFLASFVKALKEELH